MFRVNSSQAKHAYIPPHIQAEMDHYMAHAPLALQHQAQSGVYMSGHATKAMTDYMQKALPAHLKAYVTPYVHQQATTSHLGNMSGMMQPRVIQPQAPTPNPMRRDHSLGFGQQHTVPVAPVVQPQTPTSFAFTPQYQPMQGEPTALTNAQIYGDGGQPTQPTASSGAYEFIMNSRRHRSFGLFGGATSEWRTLILLAGALGVLLLIWIITSVVSGANNDTGRLTALAQEQAELVRVSQAPITQADATTTQNLAANVSLSISSDQLTLFAYMQGHGDTIPSAQTLALQKNLASDSALQTAANNGTYDQTYRSLIAQELGAYAQQVKQTFTQSRIQSERLILSNAYSAAQLLIKQSQQGS